MAITDVITFNGEFDLLEIRLNVLKNFVDEFIVVEFPETFSGKPKELYYEKQKERYSEFNIKYVVPSLYKEKYMALAYESPNTRGAEHWKNEFCQKESIKEALTHLKDDDIVYIGDVDEIWNPNRINEGKLKLQVYSYYLNNRSNEDFWGTIVYSYEIIKNNCLNHLRSDHQIRTAENHGWHFTSMGGYEEVKRKLSDSYTRESYWTEGVEARLKDNIDNKKDFLGRNFTYTLDESRWPQWLKDNKKRYSHLCL